MNTSWQRYFEPEIIERGEMYFCRGAVKNYVEHRNYVTATVSGSKDYRVEFILNERGGAESFDCNCPYFESGFRCKHLAAAMFEYHKRHPEERKIPDEDLDLDYLKLAIRGLSRKYLGRDNFVDYWAARNYLAEMSSFIEDEVYVLIRQQKYPEALELSWIILDCFCNTPMDDDGEIAAMVEMVTHVWQEIYNDADFNFRKKMFGFLFPKLEKQERGLFVSEAVTDFVMMNFDYPEALKTKMNFCDKTIGEYSEDGEFSFYADTWELYKVEIIEKLAKNDEEVEQYYLVYQDGAMRLSYIDWLIEKRRYDEAIKLLAETIEKDDNRISHYQDRLKMIYELKSDVKMQKKILTEMLETRRRDEGSLFDELKRLYSKDEWAKIRRKVIRELPRNSDKLYYYVEEGLYVEALAELGERPGLYTLQNYAREIAKKHPEKIVEIYRETLDYEAGFSNGRAHYKDLAWHLENLSEIDGGKVVAMKLIEEWREKYPRRRAMMDELGKVERIVGWR